MELVVRGKGMDITPALHDYVEKHIDKVQRYFEKPIKINVLLSVVKDSQNAEITVSVDGVIIRAVEKTEDMYKSIDTGFDKVERQIHKYKTRLARRFKGRQVLSEVLETQPEKPENTEESDSFEVVRHKTFGVKPMSVEEAILQMNLLDHDFYVFQNAETENVCVIYRRKDSKYGLIEPKM